MNMTNSGEDRKKKVLILAPHQDDEIDLAAYTLLNLCAWDKYILYSTNGDNKTLAEVRYKEAIKAASILGVPERNIFFLGFGDNQDGSTCAFFSDKRIVTSAAGYKETYGAVGIHDYHFLKHGSHSPYTYSAFKEDLKEVILDIKADLIICVDFDSHIDHRMLSLAFDEVMCEILSDIKNTYVPEIWKRFGYQMSYFAPEDYSPKNNRENTMPTGDALKPGEYELIGKSLYQWEDRIRIPAAGNTGIFICTHSIAKALKCHVSQYALFRVFRMDNSDEVFWRKRSDNLALKAKIIASDGNASKLNDFKHYDTSDIDKVSCCYVNDTWLPINDKPEVSFMWNTEVTIERIVIYGSVLGNGYEGQVVISTDNSDLQQVISVQYKPVVIDFASRTFTKELRISFTNGFYNRNGIAEIEVYDNKNFISVLDEIGIQTNTKEISASKLGDVKIVMLVDKYWLKFMRIRSYVINYSLLLKYSGFRAVISKIKKRITRSKTLT